MKTQKMLFALVFVFASLITLPAARADDYDQASKLTFSQAVQIPGRDLPAGTYWFVLANIGSRNAVQVFNSDRSTLYATILTVDAERVKITDKTAMTFAEPGTMLPEAIVTWFYPGRDFGHEFVYPHRKEQELAQAKHHTVEVTTTTAQVNQQTVVAGD
jgi:hypothetical protein